MSLFKPETDSDNLLASVGISLLECDICGKRFSSSMVWAWPFCSAGIPHEGMTSDEQIRRQKLLAETPEKATASFMMPLLKLYGPTHLKVNWVEQTLPDVPNIPEVRLPKEKFQMFSDNYKIMGEFIGSILGKHNWCLLDILDYCKKAGFDCLPTNKETPNAHP
jgi:hypothetical protein